MTTTAYLISGLGADHRFFEKLELPAGVRVVDLHWIIPCPAETLEHYAGRLAEAINQREPFILIGLSFGGMVAAALAQTLNPLLVILISSASNLRELPPLFRMAARLRLHKLIPSKAFSTITPLTDWFFGVDTPEEKLLLHCVIRDTDPVFLKWAIGAILQWGSIHRSSNIIHIHGDADRILPARYTQADYKIAGGGHLMIWSKAKEVNAIIAASLSAINRC